MKKNTLFVVLSSLTDYEFKKLNEMVYSPYFNKSKKCTQLFELLKPFHPNYSEGEFTNESIFKHLFPDKKKITSSLNTTMSQLLFLAKELLIREKLNDRFLYKNHLLLERYLEKGLNKQFKTHYKEIQTLFSNTTKRDPFNHLEQFLIAHNYLTFQKGERGRNEASSISTLSIHLDSYYLIQKLRLNCAREILSDISNGENDEKDLISYQLSKENDHLIVYNKLNQSQFCQLYREMYHSMQNPEDETLFDNFLLLFLQTDPSKVKKSEYNEFFVHSINYCIDKIIEGKSEYMAKLFELYKLIVEFELIYQNGYLDLNRVKNIISCAAQNGELEWAESFLKAYGKEIHPDQYNSAYYFYLATIYFYKKEYNEAIQYLNRIESDLDKYYFLNRTTLLLRCYYEANESAAFLNTCKTFRANLRRNKKLTTREKRSYGTFARLAYFIHQLRDGFSKKTKIQLKEMVNDAKAISHKGWLLKKLDGLNGG